MRFTEDQMLGDYLKIVDYLTVNQTVVLINKSLKKQEETIQNSLREIENRHRKEIDVLHAKYEQDMNLVRDEMRQKFQEVIKKIDIKKKTEV